MNCPKCGTLMGFNEHAKTYVCYLRACSNELGAKDIPALIDEVAKWRARYHTARNERDALIAERAKLGETVENLETYIDARIAAAIAAHVAAENAELMTTVEGR